MPKKKKHINMQKYAATYYLVGLSYALNGLENDQPNTLSLIRVKP